MFSEFFLDRVTSVAEDVTMLQHIEVQVCACSQFLKDYICLEMIFVCSYFICFCYQHIVITLNTLNLLKKKKIKIQGGIKCI